MRRERTSRHQSRAAMVMLAAAILIIGAYFFLKKESEPRIAVREELIQGSFTDLFSDIGWVDVEKSSLQENLATDRIMFPPRFLWDEASEAVWQKQENETKIGNAKPIGEVKKNGETYEGRVFLDSREVLLVESEFEGEFGFGGSEENWLAVYGGAKGNAYQIRNGMVRDISEFFNFGVMQGGFRPQVIRGERGWYVWSREKRKPVLLKLYDDATGNIVGAYDFSKELFPREVSRIEVQKGEKKGGLMILVEKDPDPSSVFMFQDQGFEKETQKSVISKNLNTFPALVRQAKITDAALYKGEGENIQFFLSTDGENWKKAEIGKQVKFEKGEGLFWRADMEPNADKYSSPALQSIHLEYALYFPEGFEAYKERQR